MTRPPAVDPALPDALAATISPAADTTVPPAADTTATSTPSARLQAANFSDLAEFVCRILHYDPSRRPNMSTVVSDTFLAPTIGQLSYSL